MLTLHLCIPCPPPQDDPFGDSEAAEPAAPEAAAEAAAEAAQPGEPAAESAAGQDQAEEDEWGDDPFAAAPAPAAPQEPAAAAAADASQALASLALADSPAGASEVAVAGRRLVLDVLAATAGSQEAAVQLPALAAMCTFLQRYQAQAAPPAAQQALQLSWALQCAAAALPGAAARVHALMSSSRRLEEETQVGWVGQA